MASTDVTTALTARSRSRSPVSDISRWSGAAFVVAYAAAVVTTAAIGVSPYSSSRQDYVEAYADVGAAPELARAFGMLAIILFLWALARIWVALPAQRAGVPGAVIGPAGVLFVACLAANVAVSAATGKAVGSADGWGSGGLQAVPETALVLDFVADGLFWAQLVAAAVLAWAIALAARRVGAIGGWVAWVGIVLVPLLPFAWILFMAPLLAFAIWFAALVATLPLHRQVDAPER